MKKTIIPSLFLILSTFKSTLSKNDSPQQPITLETSSNKSIKTQKPIVIVNNITDQMLSYKHWTGTYKPTMFKITVNGTYIAPGKELKINSNKEELHIRYDYSFMNGYKKGAHEVVCHVEDSKNPLSIEFSWNTGHHLAIDNATIISDEKVPFEVKKVSRRKKSHT